MEVWCEMRLAISMAPPLSVVIAPASTLMGMDAERFSSWPPDCGTRHGAQRTRKISFVRYFEGEKQRAPQRPFEVQATSRKAGQIVQILGNGLTGATSVRFGSGGSHVQGCFRYLHDSGGSAKRDK